MREALSTFETDKIAEIKQQIKDAIELKDIEIAQLNEQIDIKDKQGARLEGQLAEVTQKLAQMQEDHGVEVA